MKAGAKRVVGVCIVCLLAVCAMSLDLLLDAIRPNLMWIVGLVGAALIVIVAAALLCSMFSSELSREEELEIPDLEIDIKRIPDSTHYIVQARERRS